MSTKLEIYEMRPEDIEEVQALMKASGGGDVPALDNQALRRGLLSLVARQEGRLVGALMCNLDGTCGYQYQDGQSEAGAKEQVAMALIDKATRRLKGIGVRRCRISVPEGAEGQPFWKVVQWRDQPEVGSEPISSSAVRDQMVSQFGPGGE